jgi:hypothetical protein
MCFACSPFRADFLLGLLLILKIIPSKSQLTFNKLYLLKCYEIFFNSISGGGGFQLGPLGTAATNWPIVPAPGDYEDGDICGRMIGRVNRRTRRKPFPMSLCPPQIPPDLTRREPGPV